LKIEGNLGILTAVRKQLVKPPRLVKGDVIGICAPSSPPTPAENVDRGIQYLEGLGYRVEVGKNVYRRNGYLAGSDRERAADLNHFFTDKSIKAIFTARGGYGAHRILPLLDYNRIRRSPKILVGYSDITAIQSALLAKTGLISFSGPMVSSDMSTGLKGETEEHFWRWLTSPEPPPPIKGESLIVQSRGNRNGRLFGGNLSIISTLLGSEYLPRISRPVLLLEEIGERPYRIDRMLHHLLLTGIFEKAGGAAFGRFLDCKAESGKPSLTLDQILRNAFQGARYPVITGFNIGHQKGSLSFAQGIAVRIEPATLKLRFLEGGVC
jgi:muramoyltetrapeptide carboxypeptidase